MGSPVCLIEAILQPQAGGVDPKCPWHACFPNVFQWTAPCFMAMFHYSVHQYLGVSMGIPQTGCFVVENPTYKWMMSHWLPLWLRKPPYLIYFPYFPWYSTICRWHVSMISNRHLGWVWNRIATLSPSAVTWKSCRRPGVTFKVRWQHIVKWVNKHLERDHVLKSVEAALVPMESGASPWMARTSESCFALACAQALWIGRNLYKNHFNQQFLLLNNI